MNSEIQQFGNSYNKLIIHITLIDSYFEEIRIYNIEYTLLFLNIIINKLIIFLGYS